MNSNSNSSLPVLAIVGRPNVGKSSLFNAIIRRRQAIVHEESGVTRDRIVTRARRLGREFMLVDTGGLGFFKEQGADTTFDVAIRDQLIQALEGADAIILTVEANTGPHPLDTELASLLRPLKKTIVVAANKADNEETAARAVEHYALGFTPVIPVSAAHRRNIDQMLEAAILNFPPGIQEETEALRIAVVGRPNVGKSSLVNQLLGENRVIVSDIPGTTRDALDVPIRIETPDGPRTVIMVDTAGLRRRTKVDNAVEFFSASRAKNAIKRADVVFVVLDSTIPVTAEDKRICRLVTDAGKPCLLVANKWDLAGKTTKMRQLHDEIHQRLPFLEGMQIVTTCALSGYQVSDLILPAFDLHARGQLDIPTSLINRVIEDCLQRQPPPSDARGLFKVYYAVLKKRTPHTFLLFVNRTTTCNNTYLGYLRRRLRQAFDLNGLSVKVEIKERPRQKRTIKAAQPPSRRPAPAGRGPQRNKGRKTRKRS